MINKGSGQNSITNLEIVPLGGPNCISIQRTKTRYGDRMATEKSQTKSQNITRERLIELLNEDLSREYQAIIAYVNYSQVLKGAQYMNIAAELEKHAGEELNHALIISNQIDYLGGMPTV